MIARAKEAGVCKIFIPAIDLPSTHTVMEVCRQYPGYAYPMIGLHPEEVKADWKDVLKEMRTLLTSPKGRNYDSLPLEEGWEEVLAIGEVGLDYYWSREFEKEQLEAFEEQVKWSVETRLPLMIHCRKAQNEMVSLLKKYKFKKSHLPEVLPAVVPLDRIVLETDSPYMAPVPMRGKRNESAYVKLVLEKLAESYGVSPEVIAEKTNANVTRVFGI